MYRIRRGLLQASRIIAVPGATRRDLQTILSVPGERIGLIYNGLDVRYLEHRAPSHARAGGPEARAHERPPILERYQANYPFLFYSGTNPPHKNIPRLAEPFPRLRGA